MVPADTHPEAHRIQVEVWRRMGTSGRSRAASALSAALFATVRAQIAVLHPEWSAREVTLAPIARIHAPELAARANGGRPVRQA